MSKDRADRLTPCYLTQRGTFSKGTPTTPRALSLSFESLNYFTINVALWQPEWILFFCFKIWTNLWKLRYFLTKLICGSSWNMCRYDNNHLGLEHSCPIEIKAVCSSLWHSSHCAVLFGHLWGWMFVAVCYHASVIRGLFLCLPHPYCTLSFP